ncbi:hypothetical protein GY45DRAFT_585042 [Cubamyces sp. BRFM 1775]|nr:hypothetical protein GY45DRAFT_585042 [Cubamyces sp. BRFM 1775]
MTSGLAGAMSTCWVTQNRKAIRIVSRIKIAAACQAQLRGPATSGTAFARIHLLLPHPPASHTPPPFLQKPFHAHNQFTGLASTRPLGPAALVLSSCRYPLSLSTHAVSTRRLASVASSFHRSGQTQSCTLPPVTTSSLAYAFLPAICHFHPLFLPFRAQAPQPGL